MKHQTCEPVVDFDETAYKYGLTCGYWSNDPDELDKHVVAQHLGDEDVYDLMDEQYQ